MKKISILVPTYNEEDNVIPLSEAIIEHMEQNLSDYDYEILFIDNASKDNTQKLLELLCRGNDKIKAIFNAKNFGQFNSPFYGLQQTTGDCTILMCADFQDPVEMISKYVEHWQEGYKVVIGIKATSKERKFMRFLRTCYYKLVKKMSDVEQIEHFTGFGLYDKSFIDTLRKLDDPTPFLRGIVAELGPSNRKDVPYEQQKRRMGKTKNNLYSLYDAAMLSLTSYTNIGIRIAVFLGAILSVISILVALVYLVLKLIWWDQFPAGNIPILMAVLIFGAVQLFFTGLIGEYILSINKRVMKRPLVVEDRRLNFENSDSLDDKSTAQDETIPSQ